MSVFPDRYIAEFEDALGRTVQVKLQQSDYGGLATNFKLADQPLRRVDGRSGSDELEPMRPSVVTVNVATKHEGILDDVYADNTPWRVEIKKNNFLAFRGPVRKGLRTKPADLGRGGGTITANCGLGVLQEMPFLETDGSVLTERKSLLAWWLFILNKLELDLELYTAVQAYAHGMDQALPAITQEYVDPAIYYDEDGTPWSCYDVLRDLVRGKNAFIHQRRGVWHVVQRRLFYGGSSITYRAFAHNWSGTPAGGSPQLRDSAVVVPQPSWSRRLTGSQIPTREAYSAVEISYEHGALGNVVPELDDTSAQGWNYGNVAQQVVMPLLSESRDEVQEIPAARLIVQKEVRTNPPTAELIARLLRGGRVNMEQGVRLEAGAGTTLNIDAEVLLPLHESVRQQDFVTGGFELYFQIRVQIGSTHYYLANDVVAGQLRETASWTTQESFFRFYWRLTGDLLTDVHFRTPPVPGDCTVFVSLCSALDRLANHPSVRAPYVYWSKVRVLPLVEGVDVEAGRTRIIAAETGGKEATHTIRAHHGTGPTSLHKAATTLASGGMLNDWKQGSYGIGEAASGIVAGQLQAAEAMYQLRRGRDVLRWTYTRFVDVSPIVAADEGGRQFLPVFMDEDEYWCKKTVEAVEVRQDGFTPDYSEVTDERGGTFRQGVDQGVGTLIQSMQDGRGSLLELLEITRLARDVGPGRVDSLPILPALETGLEVTRQGKVIIVAPLYGGRPVQFTMRANQAAGAEWLNVVPQVLEDVVLPAGSIVAASPRELVSIVTQTAHSWGVYLEGTRVGIIGDDVSGQVDTLPVKHLRTDLRKGTDLIIVSRSGTEEDGQRVQLREAAEREDANLLIVPTRLNVKEDDYLVPDLTQYTSEFYVSPFELLMSVEEERKEEGFTRLTHPVVASNVTQLQVAAIPDDAPDGSEYLVKNVRTGHVVKITLDGDHEQGAELLNIDSADFSIAGGWAFLPGSPVVISQHHLRSELNLLTGQVSLLTELVTGEGTSLSELILQVDDLESGFNLHASVFTANGLSAGTNVMGTVAAHGNSITALQQSLATLDSDTGSALAGLQSSVSVIQGDISTLNATNVLKASVSDGTITKMALIQMNANIESGSALKLSGDYINLTANTGGVLQGNYVAGVSGLKLDLSTGNAELNDATIRGTVVSSNATITGGVVQSANYDAGSAGFSISATNGNAEFNDVTVRGTLYGVQYAAGGNVELGADGLRIGESDGSQSWGKIVWGSGFEIDSYSSGVMSYATLTGARSMTLGGWESTDITGAVRVDGNAVLTTASSITNLRGRAVAATAPTNGQALAWNAAANQWEPTTIAVGGGDANTLDGYDSTQFTRKEENATITGAWAFPTTGFTVGAQTVTSGHVAQWKLAYGWGNHAGAGYLTAASELDATKLTGRKDLAEIATVATPNGAVTFTQLNIYGSPSSRSITHAKIGQWDDAVLWGNHADAGYLKASTLAVIAADWVFQEDVDVEGGLVVDGSALVGGSLTVGGQAVTSTRIQNWQAAHGWGNHADAGYAKLATTETFTGAKTFNALTKFAAGIDSVSGSLIVYASGGLSQNQVGAYYHPGNIGSASIGWGQLSGVPAYGQRWPSWSEVTSKPTSFTPESHSHHWSQIVSPPTYATRWPSWSEVTSKPTTFAPSAHTHPIGEITGTINAAQFGGLATGDFVRATGSVNEQITGSKTFMSVPSVYQQGAIRHGGDTNWGSAVGGTTATGKRQLTIGGQTYNVLVG